MDPLTAARRARRPLDVLAVQRFRPLPEILDVVTGAGLEARRIFFVYLAGRPAPLGGGWRVAHAAMGLFPPGLVEKAFLRIAEHQLLPEFRTVYITACDAVGARLFADLPDAAELCALLDRLAGEIDYAGRPLAAAWAEAPCAGGIGTEIERAATILREHRGEGHRSTLSAAGLLGPEAVVARALWKDKDPESHARSFGWRDDDLAAAWERLVAAGRVDGDHRLTPAGREERTTIEERTDALAVGPWLALGAAERERAVTLLERAAAGFSGDVTAA